MTKQAEKFLGLHQGGKASQIATLLRLRKNAKVVTEFRKLFHLTNVETIAVRLSRGVSL